MDTMIFSDNLLCVSCNEHYGPTAYVSYDINNPSIENVVNTSLNDNLFAAKVIIILIFDSGD